MYSPIITLGHVTSAAKPRSMFEIFRAHMLRFLKA